MADQAAALRLYMETRPHDAPDELWLNRHNNPLTTNGVYQALRRLARRAGVERFNPHSFRHAAIKRWLESGMSSRLVQELAGHEDVHTTLMIYVAYSDEDLQAAFNNFAAQDNQARP